MRRYVDHSNVDRKDQPFKTRSIIDKIIKNISKVFYPGKELSSGEALINTVQRKINILSVHFQQKQEVWKRTLPEGPHAGTVVKTLFQNYFGKEHMDNYYNSVSIGKDLIKYKIYLVGTLRFNRNGNPKASAIKLFYAMNKKFLRKRERDLDPDSKAQKDLSSSGNEVPEEGGR
ncbi:hypothetical protein ILUMI_05794 [Ignelater luminosus]|uniref:PiggyBac transposable element-derived protein domain-containing protein n=1 Tax=Ignelater luminosus TaxID=2038154 RepID=A0A8K0DB98_IGNLU|nr:hypothetical protein ILUMI_05794 [Ignelater luminosus]